MTLLPLLALMAAAGGSVEAPAPRRGALRSVIVSTSRGQLTIPVNLERGHPALPVPPLAQLLPIAPAVEADWASVDFAGQPFRFLLDAPVMVDAAGLVPLAGGAYLLRDTLFVPLQWLTDYIPRRFREGYRFDPLAGRFEESTLAPVVRTISPPVERHPITGLRLQRTVALDAGHGGFDTGNPCIYCPEGMVEKHVTLSIAKRLQRELERRGLRVIMTRTTDVALSRFDRAGYCRDDCDLFVSIHVDALNRAPGYQRVSGIHSYFLGEARTADAQRVAATENAALRYEPPTGDTSEPELFILKSLQANEILRESALLAELVQQSAAKGHPGGDRGVAQAGLAVLNTATRPAILIETGYGTNRRDAQYVSSAAGQQALALAIADGVIEYLRRYEAKTLGALDP